jgi:predicted RNA-binding Zn-ribbon protein involved in translation (DUF1610 family)
VPVIGISTHCRRCGKEFIAKTLRYGTFEKHILKAGWRREVGEDHKVSFFCPACKEEQA